MHAQDEIILIHIEAAFEFRVSNDEEFGLKESLFLKHYKLILSIIN
jgi:hypothetical protein